MVGRQRYFDYLVVAAVDLDAVVVVLADAFPFPEEVLLVARHLYLCTFPYAVDSGVPE